MSTQRFKKCFVLKHYHLVSIMRLLLKFSLRRKKACFKTFNFPRKVLNFDLHSFDSQLEKYHFIQKIIRGHPFSTYTQRREGVFEKHTRGRGLVLMYIRIKKMGKFPGKFDPIRVDDNMPVVVELLSKSAFTEELDIVIEC